MELCPGVEQFDQLRGNFEGVGEDLDGLVMQVPGAAVMARGVGSIDLTAGLRGVAAERRSL